MNDLTVSVMDMVNEKNLANFKGIQEELFSMKQAVKSHMDKGLAADEMATARMVSEAIQSAENAVEKIGN